MMDAATLAALEQALALSPDNNVLREQVLFGTLDHSRYEEARDHAHILLKQAPSPRIKLALAQCYLKLNKPAAGLFITEELLPGHELDAQLKQRLRSLHLHLLIADDRRADAQESYQAFELADEQFSEPSLESELKVRDEAPDRPGQQAGLKEEDLFFERPSTTFSDVGGMDGVKREINLKIIAPLRNPELFKRYGKRAGGGILLYGPPGCGKTFLARATAGEIDARFMSIGLDDILSMWRGESERKLAEYFKAARRRSPAVIFVDEIDALAGRRRQSAAGTGLSTVVNSFLHELDGIEADNEGLLVLGATNLPWHVDGAFLRPGRFDRIIFVPPPDQPARRTILELELRGKPTDSLDLDRVAAKTNGFSGADLVGLIDRAVEARLTEALMSGREVPITTKDLLAAAKQSRPSVKDWLATARNYVLYSNESGLYDEVRDYLKL